jgi:hypothetical protein
MRNLESRPCPEPFLRFCPTPACGHVERLIGSIRRECLDQVIVCDDAHLRRVLRTYASYYNEVRTHLSLNKDAPDVRPM